MTKNSIFILSCICIVLFFSPATAFSAEISGPTVRIENNEIFVDTGLSYLGDLESTILSGLEKEFIFTIELFRVWNLWPDEFVVSKKVQRAVKYDRLREQFFTSTNDGITKAYEKFKDFLVMKNWVFRVRNINIANVRELRPGRYYLRVVVESKSRELPPTIGLLMFFIPEVEMSLAKESQSFRIGSGE
jgi:hypothetical protein